MSKFCGSSTREQSSIIWIHIPEGRRISWAHTNIHAHHCMKYLIRFSLQILYTIHQFLDVRSNGQPILEEFPFRRPQQQQQQQQQQQPQPQPKPQPQPQPESQPTTNKANNQQSQQPTINNQQPIINNQQSTKPTTNNHNNQHDLLLHRHRQQLCAIQGWSTKAGWPSDA